MKKFIKTLGAVLTGMALVFGAISCSPQIEYKTVEKKVYTCPTCGTEYESAEEAQNCCDVQYVTKFVCPECGTEYLKAEDAAACYASHQPVADTTAPSAVTNLSAINLDNAVALKWTDPTASDLFGIEITWTPQTVNASRAVAAMEANSLFVAPGKQIAEISNLKNGVEYTFTVKAMDTSGNKSSATTVTKTPAEIAGSVLAITLNPATTTVTKENYAVSVAVTTKEGRSIKKIKYAADSKELDYFASSGTTVTNGSFTVSSNGVYTVYAQDIDGRVGLKRITISNIDKTAPAKVTGLTAVYNHAEKKINVSWTNPGDTDFNNVLLSYTKAGTAVETDKSIAKPATSYEFDYETDGTSELVFTVKAVDTAGNVSETATYTFTPVAGATVTEITLNRYHFAYYDADQTVTATASIANINQIAEGTTVKFQIVNGDTVTSVNAALDKTAGTATATLTAPTTSSSRNGTTYTVRLKIGDEPDTTHTARFNVSEGPELGGIYQAKKSSVVYSNKKIQFSKKDITEESKLYVRVEGYNLDLQPVTLQFFNSTGAEYYQERVQIPSADIKWTATTGVNDQSVYIVLPCPQDEDTYTLKAFINGIECSKTVQLQIYDVPKFTSFTIPKAGTAKEDSKLTAIVKGKNFTAPGVTASSFVVSCTSKSSITRGSEVTIVDDNTLNVTLTIPGTAGSYDVTITSGENSQNGIFTVKNTAGIAAGDFILKKEDGSTIFLSKDAELSAEQKSNVVAVAFFDTNGVLFGLGLKQSSSTLAWAPYDTTGFNTKFTEIVSYNTTGSGDVSKATITGDTDGSDNWEYVKSIDPTGTADAATNYPAFNFAATYGTTAGLEGELATGWYMPSIAELCDLCKNKDVLNTSLEKAGGIQIRNGGYDYYWSSSQSSSNKYAWALEISSRYLYTKYKGNSSYKIDGITYNCYVCCIRTF